MKNYRIQLALFLLMLSPGFIEGLTRADERADPYSQAIAEAQKSANSGDFLEAFAAAKRAVGAKPDGYQGHYLAGYAAWKLNQPEKARVEAGQAFELAPPNAKIEARTLLDAVRQSASPAAPALGVGEIAKPLPTGKDDNRVAYEQCMADANKAPGGSARNSYWRKAQQLEPAEPTPYLLTAYSAYLEKNPDVAISQLRAATVNCHLVPAAFTEDLNITCMSSDLEIRQFFIDSFGQNEMEKIKSLPMRKLKAEIAEINKKGRVADAGRKARTTLTLSPDEKQLIIDCDCEDRSGRSSSRANISIYRFGFVQMNALAVIGQSHTSGCVIGGPRDAFTGTLDGKSTENVVVFFACDKEDTDKMLDMLGLRASYVKMVLDWPQKRQP